jgi:hypothetical protein
MRRRQMTCEREREERRKDRDVLSCTAVSGNVDDLHGHCIKLFSGLHQRTSRFSQACLPVRFLVLKMALQQVLWQVYSTSGKAIPLQALTGPDGSRSLRLPDFKTFGT